MIDWAFLIVLVTVLVVGNPKILNKWKRTDYRALRKNGFGKRIRYICIEANVVCH